MSDTIPILHMRTPRFRFIRRPKVWVVAENSDEWPQGARVLGVGSRRRVHIWGRDVDMVYEVFNATSKGLPPPSGYFDESLDGDDPPS